MSTPHTHGALTRNTLNVGDPTLLDRATELDGHSPDLDTALRIASVLQTTLEVEGMLNTFFAEAGKWIPLDGLGFTAPELERDIKTGTAARNSLTYRLAVHEEVLGELTVWRRRKFSNKEILALENLLCGLIYPLRNGLAYSRAVHASLIDPLTAVGNRTSLNRNVEREVDLARRHGTPLSLITVDVDYFKHINDTHGHSTGDCVLKHVAQCIARTARRSDMVFRYGGEEFVILLSNTADKGALRLAERIRRKIEDTQIACNGAHIAVTASLGVAWLADGDDSARLFSRADEAMYEAKRAGRNRVAAAD